MTITPARIGKYKRGEIFAGSSSSVNVPELAEVIHLGSWPLTAYNTPSKTPIPKLVCNCGSRIPLRNDQIQSASKSSDRRTAAILDRFMMSACLYSARSLACDAETILPIHTAVKKPDPACFQTGPSLFISRLRLPLTSLQHAQPFPSFASRQLRPAGRGAASNTWRIPC